MSSRASSVSYSIGLVTLVAVPVVVASGLIAGAMVAVHPVLGLLLGVAVGAMLLLSLGERLVSIYVVSLGVILTGYAFFGRGFAYIGFSPVFVGEMLLGVTLLAMLVSIHRARLSFTSALLLLLMLLGAIATAPHVSTYGLDAIRDAAVWGYAIFALAAAWMVRRHHLDSIVSWYRKAVPFLLIWIPIGLLIRVVAGELERIPILNFSPVDIKGGDMGVHLAGAGAFILLGLWSRSSSGAIRESLMWAVWFTGVAVVSALNRGGMLAVALGMSAAMLLRPNRRVATMMIAAVLAVSAIAVVDPLVEFGTYRELSITQVMSNVRSVLFASDRDHRGDTAEWRLTWWNDIVDYTVRGPYFWTGKGFGINLADADGFQVHEDSVLRSPHNGHLTILARMGVPGIAVWVLMNASFAVMMVNGIVRGYRQRDPFWVQLLGWLFVYWIAFMVNASFDVYLEGPQGGIWYWTVLGLGIAATRMQAAQGEDDDERENVDSRTPVEDSGSESNSIPGRT